MFRPPKPPNHNKTFHRGLIMTAKNSSTIPPVHALEQIKHHLQQANGFTGQVFEKDPTEYTWTGNRVWHVQQALELVTNVIDTPNTNTLIRSLLQHVATYGDAISDLSMSAEGAKDQDKSMLTAIHNLSNTLGWTAEIVITMLGLGPGYKGDIAENWLLPPVCRELIQGVAEELA